ncbi:MAG: NAD(+) synthase, partial [Candidatus Melainabacteria bacterium]|nr:NAD(+) synthase [Candidatus Melainabacteria bacterium]
MRILTAQLNPTIGDLEGNLRKILQSIEHARAKKADLVLFAELALCGYPPEDLLLHPSFVDDQERYLDQVIRASHGIIVVLGMVRRNRAKGEKPICNSAAVIQNGKLLGFVDKRLLPTYDVFDERRYFEPGTTTPVWDLNGKKVAITICEDIWQHAKSVGYTDYAVDPVLDVAIHKPDLMLNLSASPYMFQKPDLRAKVCIASAKTLHCPLIMCCQVGGNDQLVFDGYSLFLDAEGAVRQIAKGFEEDEMLVDLNAPPAKTQISFDPLEDLYRALVLGVRDYMHKEGFTKGCLGLSGGVDSALVACIAVDALGKENVLGLSMPSRYSSKGSIEDAEILAQTLGIELIQIPIEKPFQSFLDLLEPFFQNKGSDVTEENMQARIRGMILMAISNKFGHIVLSTGNKSEIAFGYC